MKYLEMLIECEEPLKISEAISNSNSSNTLTYIPGSVLRGAFIWNYIRRTKIKDIDKNEESRRWFFNNKLEFLNGYIVNEDGERCIPMPAGIYASQKDILDYNFGEGISIKNHLEGVIKDTDKKLPSSEYVKFDDGELKSISVRKINNLHIRKQKEELDKTMFRYEAIKEGQIFKSYIKCDLEEEEIKKVIEILEIGEFYLGGSKGSGYGKVSIEVVCEDEENPEIIETDNDYDGEFYIYALSDAIYMDSYGKVINHIDEAYLKSELDLEDVKLVDMDTDTIVIGGYNNKWGCRLPQYVGNKAGALFKYSYDGEMDEELLNDITNNGVGLRTDEGYGRIAILANLDIDRIEKEVKSNRLDECEVKLSDNEMEQVQLMVNSLCRNKIEEKMQMRIIGRRYDWKGKSEINTNQIGKLVTLFNNAQSKKSKEGISYINSYLKHLSKKANDGKERENQEALNQLKDLKINEKNTIEFIENELKSIEEGKKEFEVQYAIDDIKIGDIHPQLNEEEMYIYKMIEIEKVFRYILRREASRNGIKE